MLRPDYERGKYLLIIALVCLAGLCLKALSVEETDGQKDLPAAQKEPYKPKYQTIAHRALELESEVEGVEPNYELLDSIIDAAKRRIAASRADSKEEAIKVLQTIHDILIEKNFLYKDGIPLLSDSLQPQKLSVDTIEYIKKFDPERDTLWKYPSDVSGKLLLTRKQKAYALSHLDEEFHFADCNTLTFLYLAIGQVLNLPLHVAYAPQHTFIRWHFSGGSYFNWETTSGYVETDEECKLSLNIPAIAVRSGAYLRSLSETEALANIYSNRGLAWEERDQLDKAIVDFNKALAINPNFAEAYNNRGIAYVGKGKYARAITDYNKALAINPNNAKVYSNRGNAYHHKGDCDRAIADYTKAIAINPNLAEAYYNRGVDYIHKGEYDRAITDFAKALSINPNDAEVYINRGVAFFLKDEHDRAMADLSKAIAINPNFAEAYKKRAVLWFFKNDYVHAWEDVKRCQQLGESVNPKFIQQLREASGQHE